MLSTVWNVGKYLANQTNGHDLRFGFDGSESQKRMKLEKFREL